MGVLDYTTLDVYSLTDTKVSENKKDIDDKCNIWYITVMQHTAHNAMLIFKEMTAVNRRLSKKQLMPLIKFLLAMGLTERLKFYKDLHNQFDKKMAWYWDLRIGRMVIQQGYPHIVNAM